MNKFTTHKNNLIARCEQRGYTIEEVEACILEKLDNDIWVIDVDHPAYPSKSKENFDHPSYRIMEDIRSGKIKDTNDIGEGAGTELKKLLSWMNIQSTPNCSCNKRAKLMNDKGIDWCKNNLDEICDWLKEESEKRKIPFFKYGAQKLIKLAISRAERKQK